MIDHHLKFINICFNHHLQDGPLALVVEYLLRDSEVAGSNPTLDKILFFIFFYFCNICPKKLISKRFVCPKHYISPKI